MIALQTSQAVEFDTRRGVSWRMLVFFEDFTFDRRAKILSRAAQPLMLTAQTLELLDILLESPGELISREMIRHRLWPGSNVEFEHSLDVLVSRRSEERRVGKECRC